MAIENNTYLSNKTSKTRARKLPDRNEIDNQYKWNITDVYPSDEAWEKDFDKLKKSIPEIEKYQGKLNSSSENLLKCLQTRDNLEILLSKLSFYSHLKSDEDTRVSKYQAYQDRVTGLAVQLQHKTSFIQPEIISIPKEIIQKFIKENEALKIYQHYLDDLIRSKDHVLKREGEELLALAGEMSRTPYQVFSMFNNADITFPSIKDEEGNEVELTKGNFSVYMRSANREVRKAAFDSMYYTYKNWINTLSASLSGAIKRNIFYAKARKYPTALEASLDQDNIPTEVYNNVINALNQNLKPMHRYINVRKDVLGLDKVHPWDLYVPLLTKVKWEIPYQEAVQTVQEALYPLGDDYLNIMKKGFNSGWLDVYENKGKRSGAYSSAVYGAPHPYMLLNYNDMLDDMFTLTHEMGHSMHSYFSINNQPYIYSNYTIFVAEVASTLNEALLMDYLLQQTHEKERKLYLINQYIDQIRSTVYIQGIFAEFEKTIHEKAESGEALTAEVFNQIAHDIYTRYYGPEFVMDSLYDINWARIPHFYYNFYVFQYATGFAAATALSQKILAGDTAARDAYLHFLSRGSSDYSINLLKDAGIDMTTSEPIEATARLFEKLLKEMEETYHSLS